jgi:peptidoglycan/xylan/chitin deacetylase (PgdA/CDA1 family)
MKIFKFPNFGKHKKLISGIAVTCLIAVAGTIIVIRSHAVTPTAAAEAEKGIVSTCGTSPVDTTASAAKAVKFKGCSGGTTFNRAIVSLTFDDSTSDQYVNVRPLLNQYGVKGTYFIITSTIGQSSNSMSAAQIKTLYAEGNEIGAHTVTHPHMTTLSATDLTSQLQDSQTTLQNLLGVPILDYAAPYGETNATVDVQVKKYYQSQRLVTAGANTKANFQPYALHGPAVGTTTSAATVQGWIDQAIASKGWLVILMHHVSPTLASGNNSTTNAILNSTLSYLQTKQVAVETVQQALTEVTSQL